MTKIDIFSGFLGAGKTTLIKKLINDSFKGEKLVLIENEFGEIGIDGGFLQDAGIEITEMNSGCICCSLVGDFTKALEKVRVTDDEARKFFDENPDQFAGSETFNASHILVDTEEKAREIADKIKSGEISFEDCAKENSSCPSGGQGGNLGDFTRGQMVPEFDTAVFSMEVGEITKTPVKTQFGYHLINLTDKKEASEMPFEQIKDQLAQKVLTDKQQAAYASKLNQLKILYPVDMF